MVPLHIHIDDMTCSQERRERELAFEHLRTMRIQETLRYGPLVPNGSGEYEARASSNVAHEEWRRKICGWCFEVVDYYDLSREVVTIAMYYLDRFDIVSPHGISGKEYQLVAIASLYVAIKIHGETDSGMRKVFPICAFTELTGGRFGRDAIEKMESKILNALNWQMNPPTSARFVEYTKQLVRNDCKFTASSVFDTARFFTEVAVCSSELTFQFKPSVIAYASILCSMEAHQDVIPSHVQNDVIKNATLATSLLPNINEVCQARSLLVELWHEVTPLDLPRGLVVGSDDSTSTFERGTSSPVCVRAERQREVANQCRKRSRSPP